MRAVAARQQGDTYQGRVFWLEACRLFQRHPRVSSVGYEIDDVPHFEDVSVVYSEPVRDAHGELVSADYYQIKWHVDQRGALTCDALTDPSFVGSKRTSLLQRLHEAVNATSARSETARFNFMTTWNIPADDILAKLVSARDGELRLDVLFDRKTSGRFSRVVDRWSRHLGVSHEQLRRVLSRLRICANAYSLDCLTRTLSENMARAGLRAVDEGKRANPYDSLIERLFSEGRNKFTGPEIQSICSEEGLWTGPDSDRDEPLVGIRSFLRFAEHMEDEVDHMLDLTALFDGREIGAAENWNAKAGPTIREFMTRSVAPLGQCQLHLSAHSSIAFAAGYELDPKSGTRVSFIQNTAAGRSIWEFSSAAANCNSNLWSVSEIIVNPKGQDIGIVFSATHDARPEVLAHAQDHIPQLGQLLVFSIEPHVGPTAVQGGNHAWVLAQELVKIVRERHPRRDSVGPLHVFGAAPNGLVFLIGRLARSLGPIQLYEHAFESDWSTRYRESLTLPAG
ncbi:MAG: SAVED domain-containing protein [Chloroflexi bacterium]|nr:SAVED domain-containing protein [Chloroflexota bacterium]MYF78869.1 SAVED domain-containing protein [Chloroflexota bacterium]MYK60457.1 SAVED domain-containing protein [Chloroflexota bacterium]